MYYPRAMAMENMKKEKEKKKESSSASGTGKLISCWGLALILLLHEVTVVAAPGEALFMLSAVCVSAFPPTTADGAC